MSNTATSNAFGETVIGAIFEVANTLGAGVLEKAYERALVRELRLRGMRVDVHAELATICTGEAAGNYLADLVGEPEGESGVEAGGLAVRVG